MDEVWGRIFSETGILAFLLIAALVFLVREYIKLKREYIDYLSNEKKEGIEMMIKISNALDIIAKNIKKLIDEHRK